MSRSFILPTGGPRLARRLVQLLVGLISFGLGTGMMLQSRLGLPPWDVLHHGLAMRFGLTVGIWSMIISGVVLLGWLPLGERYGIGTVLNAVVVGIVIDLSQLVVPEPESMIGRGVILAVGIVVTGFASGLYIGANLGPGPRDGLMTGIAKRGPTIRFTRTLIEVIVLAAGWLMGGTFGIGTIAFALLIGPLVHFFLPRLDVDPLHPNGQE